MTAAGTGDVEVVTLRAALFELVEVLDHGLDVPPPALDPPALGLSLLEPGRFEDVFAAGRAAQVQLPFELPPSGRVVLVCAQPLIPWLAACGWGLEAARAGATVTVACPYEAHAMAALFVTLGSSLSWRHLDHFRFDAIDWRVLIATLERICALDVSIVHAEPGRSSAWALAGGPGGGGIVIAHPDDGIVGGDAPPGTLLLQPAAALWPPTEAPTGQQAGDSSLRKCAAGAARPRDHLIGVGLLDPLDGVLVGEARH